MNRYKHLIKSDIEFIRNNANFNAEQAQVFEELIKPDYGVFEKNTAVFFRLHLSEAKFYRIKKEIDKKIDRILND